MKIGNWSLVCVSLSMIVPTFASISMFDALEEEERCLKSQSATIRLQSTGKGGGMPNIWGSKVECCFGICLLEC